MTDTLIRLQLREDLTVAGAHDSKTRTVWTEAA